MNPVAQDEHLLCILPWPEPKELTDLIKKENPNMKITYHQFVEKMDWTNSEKRSEETYSNATILFTLTNLPEDPVSFSRIKLVHLFSTGTDHIWNSPLYKDSKIPITTSAGVSAPAIAEWVIMNILVASRKYHLLRDWQLAHAWNDDNGGKAMFAGVSLSVGKRMGILGYGSIGRQVASIVKSLGMDVVVCTANPRKSEESKRYTGYAVAGIGDLDGKVPSQWFHTKTKESLHSFLDQGLDYLLIVLPLTKTSKRLLGAEEFEILSRRNTFIINVARAEIMEQDCLIKALHNYEDDKDGLHGQGRKGISGAAVDVAEPEPLPENHPLWNAPNCIISPHVAGISREYGLRSFEILRMNLKRLAEGKKLLNEIHREVGYASSAMPDREASSQIGS